MKIENEQREDSAKIESLYQEIFGKNFPNMARAANLLRAGHPLDLSTSFVICNQKREIQASVRNWKILIQKNTPEQEQQVGLLLGPVLVLSHLRGEGLGRALIAHTKKVLGDSYPLITIGDPGFFVPLGFRALSLSQVHIDGEIAPLSILYSGKDCDKITALRRIENEN